MSYRREGKKIHQSEWALWLKEHADLVAAAGLPPLITSTEEHWNYFFNHNSLYPFADDPSAFRIEKLTLRQRAAILRLLMTWPSQVNSTVGYNLIMSIINDIEAAYEDGENK